MKKIILFYCLMISFGASAQNLNGKVICSKNQIPVQYANIGILNKNTGTTSNSDGKFTLDISKASETDTVRISCIGYETLNMQIKALKSITDHEITLQQHIYTLRETTVHPRRVKNKKLGVTSYSNKILAGFKDNFLGYEMGILMKNKKSAKINKININIGSCSFDTIFYRINVYEVRKNEKDQFVNILREPVYISIPKEQIKKTVIIDVSKRDIYVSGNFLVTIEHIKNNNQGSLYFSCGIGHSTWHRRTSQGTWESTPIGIGLNVDAEVEY